MTNSSYLRQPAGPLPPKAKIIERVERGEITWEKAEAEAASLGLGALETRPDPALFDPMKEPSWSLPMILGHGLN
jgi:hypothetical protein